MQAIFSMKRVCILLASCVWASAVPLTIDFDFNEGIEKYGQNAVTYYSELNLPGWKFDDNTVDRGGRDAFNHLSYRDGFGIVMNLPGTAPGGESGELLFNTPVYSATIDSVINIRSDWDNVPSWFVSNWSITAFDSIGNELDSAEAHYDTGYWHIWDTLSVESETPIAKVVVWTDKNIAIDNLTISESVPDGGRTAALLGLGIVVLIGLTRFLK